MTTLELLESTTRYFTRHQIASPRLTIELLLAEMLQKTRLQLYLEYENPVPEPVLDRLRPLVKRRAEGEPLEYLLGQTTFAGHRIQLTPDVLIPRPETEILLQEALKRIDPLGLPVIDLGTGSGILALAVAKKFPTLALFAADISPNALQVAKKNLADCPQVVLLVSDLLAHPEFPPQAQILMANLPYLPRNQINTLAREVRHEPRLALDGGADGLELIARLVKESSGRTHYLLLEFGDGQAESVKGFCAAAGYALIQTLKDFTDRERILVAQTHG